MLALRLQESLGGNAKTSLVIAVANAVQHCEETLQSLQFGSRAMRVQTQAVVNECLDFKVTPCCVVLISQHMEGSECIPALLQAAIRHVKPWISLVKPLCDLKTTCPSLR